VLLNQKTRREMKINLKDDYLKRLELREKNIDSSMNNLWLMKTPEREENLPSPPYIITKEEFN
jgi:hypothetical protein